MSIQNRLYQGDTIALHASTVGIGYLCLPSNSEPLPEREEKISHVRANSHSLDNITSDFSERCLFKIADEKGIGNLITSFCLFVCLLF